MESALQNITIARWIPMASALVGAAKKTTMWATNDLRVTAGTSQLSLPYAGIRGRQKKICYFHHFGEVSVRWVGSKAQKKYSNMKDSGFQLDPLMPAAYSVFCLWCGNAKTIHCVSGANFRNSK